MNGASVMDVCVLRKALLERRSARNGGKNVCRMCIAAARVRRTRNEVMVPVVLSTKRVRGRAPEFPTGHCRKSTHLRKTWRTRMWIWTTKFSSVGSLGWPDGSARCAALGLSLSESGSSGSGSESMVPLAQGGKAGKERKHRSPYAATSLRAEDNPFAAELAAAESWASQAEAMRLRAEAKCAEIRQKTAKWHARLHRMREREFKTVPAASGMPFYAEIVPAAAMPVQFRGASSGGAAPAVRAGGGAAAVAAAAPVRREEKKDEPPSCVICLCGLGSFDVSTLVCGHVFHGRCVEQWLSEKRECPTCRHDPSKPIKPPKAATKKKKKSAKPRRS